MKTFLGVILTASVAVATPPCHVQQIQAVPYQYATPVLPLYTVGYQPAVDLTPLLEELRAMRQDLQRLQAGGPLALRDEPAGLKVLRSACSKCHTEGGAKGGFTLFSAAGQLVETPEMAGKVIGAIHAGKMPPVPAKLADGEKYDVLHHLTVRPVAGK